MAQVSKYPISDKVYQRILEIFLKTLVEIKTKDEAQEFIKDFLTPTEQIMLAKRLTIAFLLEKDYEYRTICKILRVSFPTVASVSLMKKIGGRGYRLMLKKLLTDEKIKEFLLKFGESLSELMTKGKGSGHWRYLRQELRRKRLEKPF